MPLPYQESKSEDLIIFIFLKNHKIKRKEICLSNKCNINLIKKAYNKEVKEVKEVYNTPYLIKKYKIFRKNNCSLKIN